MTDVSSLGAPWGPSPADRTAQPPFVLDQRPGPGGTVYVTYSLPGLRRLVLTVPQASWLNGEHTLAAHIAAGLIQSLVPPAPTPTQNDDVDAVG